MQRAVAKVDSAPRRVARLPFASESGLQRFVEEHAEDLFGVKVVASALRGGGRILNIDILAVDDAGRPWIFECKHDRVGAGAFRQLHRYRGALVSNWPAVRQQLAALHAPITLETPNPRLVLIGYRYDQNFADELTACLAYRYHDVRFTDDELQTQKEGGVSLHDVGRVAVPTHPHPKVSKKFATIERLERLAPKLAATFWTLDAELRALKGAMVTYGGKNFVRYRAGDMFAEAVICPGSIQWRIKADHVVDVHRDSDVAKVLQLLHRARSL